MKAFYIALLIIIGYLLSMAVPAQAAVVEADAIQKLPLYSITLEEIEKQVAHALTEKGAGEIVEATLNGQEKNTVYGSDTPVTLVIKGLEFEPDTKRWTANLLFNSGDTVLSAIPAGGRFQTMVKLPTLNTLISAGEVITKEHIAWKTFPAQYARKSVMNDEQLLIGQTPRSNISPDRPIRDTEISKLPLVKKDAVVQMNFQTANLHISTTGQALTDGAKGEIISVKNVNSKQVVRAIVVDERTVNALPQVQTSALGEGLNAFN